MEEIIYKYLNKTLTQEENERLKSWLELREENRVILNKLSSYYKNDESRLPMMKDVVWNEINQRLGNSSASMKAGPSSPWGMILKIAAVFLIISAIAFVVYQYSIETDQKEALVANIIIKETPMGSKITTRLPDGSTVTLNSGTQISFPDQFIGNTREVVLSGEAFFEVKHNPNKPFYVRMNGDKVRVLGTSFNIRSYPEDDAVYVSVATGRVSYTIPSGKEVILKPEQMATYDRSNGSLSKGTVDKLQAFGWKDRIIYFKSTTFDNVILELERWYGVEIEVSGDFQDLGPFTGEFRNEALDHVLRGLSYVYPFSFKIEDKKVILNKISTLN